MGRTRPIILGDGERFVPLSDAVDLLGAPSIAALRARIYRAEASPHTSAAAEGFEKRGGRWFALIGEPKDTVDGEEQ